MSPKKSKLKGKTESSALNKVIHHPTEDPQVKDAVAESKTAVAESINSKPSTQVDPKLDGQPKESQDGAQTKTKAELRAERRQLQEAQRAAKAAKQQQQQPQQKQPNSQQKQPNSQQKQQQQQTQNAAQNKKPNATSGKQEQPKPKAPSQTDTNAAQKEKKKKKNAEEKEVADHIMARMFASQQVRLFRMDNEKRDEILGAADIRQSVISFGLKLGHRVITDSLDIMKGLVFLLIEIVENFEAVDKKSLVKEIIEELNSHIGYLAACRPLTLGMTNLIKHLKYHVMTFIDRNDLSEEEFKSALVKVLRLFYKENIQLAQNNISDEINRSLGDDEIVIVYGYSKLILKCLYKAKQKGKNFKVVVVHHSYSAQAKKMIESLTAFGVECELSLLKHLSPWSELMVKSTRVLLSTEAAFVDGSVLTESGGQTLCAAGRVAGVPVMFLCESFKFSDVNTSNMQSFNVIEDTKDGTLSVMYDIVPSKLVPCLVTEMGFRSGHSIEKILKKKWISTYVVY